MYRAPPFGGIYKATHSIAVYEGAKGVAGSYRNQRIGLRTPTLLVHARNRAGRPGWNFVEMKRCQCQEGEVGREGKGREAGPGRADCIHCLDGGMMSPQYYAESRRTGRTDGREGERAINVGMYRDAATAAAVAQTQNSALILIISSHF